MSDTPSGAPHRSSNGLLGATLVLLMYWMPALVGGDYSRGDFEMTPVRVGAASLLAASLPVCVWVANRLGVRRWTLPALALVASAGLVNLALAVSAAWVHVPPLEVLCGAFVVAAAPALLLPFVERKAWLVLGCTAVSTALSTFFLGFVHPYL